ncbi:hypothetical protein CkaCkLH20_02348 [Colletotrichum karsti]|uniref:Uncharacterized protein n=1 Tax=Colletotrichum karsti TaxID=1095194 RepID=A0A9P6LLG0_9PEZI|nr:uncharacterized protein CkaCkLH20_02348 [Colletotrichum karsti]KAF9880394.1 hypothetical protein CkaCkLH20_02348 [Colletotrichum karsti]
MNSLRILSTLDPKNELCYLPSRYYLYGVYAAVFLHKANSADAIQPESQREEARRLAISFADAMEEAASTESHIGSRCSRMLKALWCPRDRGVSGDIHVCLSSSNTKRPPTREPSRNANDSVQISQSFEESNIIDLGSLRDTNSNVFNTPGLGQGLSTMDEYMFAPFMPDFNDLELGNIDDILGEHFSEKRWEMGQDEAGTGECL